MGGAGGSRSGHRRGRFVLGRIPILPGVPGEAASVRWNEARMISIRFSVACDALDPGPNPARLVSRGHSQGRGAAIWAAAPFTAIEGPARDPATGLEDVR